MTASRNEVRTQLKETPHCANSKARLFPPQPGRQGAPSSLERAVARGPGPSGGPSPAPAWAAAFPRVTRPQRHAFPAVRGSRGRRARGSRGVRPRRSTPSLSARATAPQPRPAAAFAPPGGLAPPGARGHHRPSRRAPSAPVLPPPRPGSAHRPPAFDWQVGIPRGTQDPVRRRAARRPGGRQRRVRPCRVTRGGGRASVQAGSAARGP